MPNFDEEAIDVLIGMSIPATGTVIQRKIATTRCRFCASPELKKFGIPEIQADFLYKTGYDFKRLFTISEYYDRDRSNYYKAIQSVREKDMDMTFWLEYFVNGLATQLQEVQNRGQQVMKLDILSIQHHLSKREKEALEQALDEKGFSIKEFQLLFPETSKRTLQRELKHLLEIGLLKVEGSTNDRRYLINL